jgi:hypothetical protein
VPEFTLPVLAPFGLCGRMLSLAAISGALSPYPKIPFLADKAQRLTSGFVAREPDLGGVGNGGVFLACAIVAGSTQALRTADSIPLERRAAAQC